jgi:HAMP domain-containing protein
MQRLSIRARLGCAIAFIVLSLAAIWATNHYFRQNVSRLQAVETQMTALHAQILEMRRAEKNFLAHRDEAYVKSFQSSFTDYQQGYQKLMQSMGAQGLATGALSAMHDKAIRYRDDFMAVVAKQREMGMGTDEGHYGRLSEAASSLEKVVEGNPGLMVSLLTLRRHEKNFMLERELVHSNRFLSALAPFRNQFFMADIDNETRGRAQSALAEYADRFEQLVALEREIGLSRSEGLLGRMTESVEAAETAFADARETLSSRLQRQMQRQRYLYVGILGSVMLMAVVLLALINRGVSRSFHQILNVARSLRAGDWGCEIPRQRGDEVGVVMRALADMRDELREKTRELDRDNRVKTRHAELARALRGRHSVDDLADAVIRYLTPELGCHVGAFLVHDEQPGLLRCVRGYALSTMPAPVEPGEGLAGQAALEGELRLVRNLPAQFLPVTSGTGRSQPGYVWLVPLVRDGTLYGLIELAGWGEPDESDTDFLQAAAESIAVAVQASQASAAMERALAESREQARELEDKQAEMTRAHEQLEQQSQRLQASEEELRAQEEELRVTNEELESQTRTLQQRNRDLEERNRELEQRLPEPEPARRSRQAV